MTRSVPADPRARKAEYLATMVAPLLPSGVESVEPRCSVFDICGGCQLQHVPYPDQLVYKRRLLLREFQTAGLDLEAVVEPVRGMSDDPWHYRNKADFTVRTWDDEIHLGYRPHGGDGELVEPETCPILLPLINDVLGTLRRSVQEAVPLRRRLVSVVARASLSEDRAAILLHSKVRDEVPHLDVIRRAMAEEPRIGGGLFVRKRHEYTAGSVELTEVVDGLRFGYTVRTFFQANSRLLGELVRVVEELAQPCDTSSLLDIYCGVGLFALRFAGRFAEVFGIESSPSSVEAARRNAEANTVTNARFFRDTAEDRLGLFLRTGGLPDLVVLDPPRSGLAPSVIEALAALVPSPVVVMVSCNPVSFARDLAALTARGFIVERVVPVDMFPQTEHLEVVARLTRRGGTQ